MKPLIVWDFDDVLFPLTEFWFAAWGQKIQAKITRYDQITENPPHKMMEISLNQYLETLDQFRNSEQAQSLPLNPTIFDWLQVNGAFYNHFILTARPLHTIEVAQNWLNNNFPEPLEGFGVVPAERAGQDLTGYYRTKQDYLEGEGIKFDYFIDDNPVTIGAVSKIHRAATVLFPAPWNVAWAKRRNIQALLPGTPE